MINQLVENCMNRIHATIWTLGSIPWTNSIRESIEEACNKAYEAGRQEALADAIDKINTRFPKSIKVSENSDVYAIQDQAVSKVIKEVRSMIYPQSSREY